MRFCKFVLSLLLLPPVCLVGWETGRMVWGVLGHFQTAAGFFLGAVVYAAIHYGCYNFSRPYVLVHEMTHALAALLCGSRVKDFSVKKESGYVKLDKANMFIMLAPYFIPGYVIAVVFVYIILGLFFEVTPWRQLFLFLIGFFSAFHWIQTVKTLREADQPDLKLAGGKIFSLVTISLANLVVLALVLKGLFPQEVSLSNAAENVARNTWRLGCFLVHYIKGN